MEDIISQFLRPARLKSTTLSKIRASSTDAHSRPKFPHARARLLVSHFYKLAHSGLSDMRLTRFENAFHKAEDRLMQ